MNGDQTSGGDRVLEDGVAIWPSFPRMCLFFAGAVAVFNIVILAQDYPSWDRECLIASCVVSLPMIPLFAAFGMVMFRFRVTDRGIESILPPCAIGWDEAVSVREGLPRVFCVVRSGSYFANRFIIVPKRWLIGKPDVLEDALRRFAPDGHPLRTEFLGKSLTSDCPTARSSSSGTGSSRRGP